MKKKYHRNWVLRKVRPFVSPEGLETLREDLRDPEKDWGAHGSGYWLAAGLDESVTVTQCRDDLDYFEIEIVIK